MCAMEKLEIVSFSALTHASSEMLSSTVVVAVIIFYAIGRV